MSKTFTVKVRGKIAAAEYTEPYVCDNSDYEIEFDFSEEWQVYELKTARFAYGGKMQDVIFEGSRCGVPRMSGIRSFKVGVFVGDLSTTTPAYIEARASILSEGGAPAVPAPYVYDQLMQRMNEIEAPDWNQNDETKKDYIKGRTHWVETVYEKVYQNDKAPFVDNGYGRIFFTPDEVTWDLEKGDKYKIIFDGIEYLSTCITASRYGRSWAWIGNASFGAPYNEFESDNGQPFLITDSNIEAKSVGNHSISMYYISEEYHRIGEEFMDLDAVYAELDKINTLATRAHNGTDIINTQMKLDDIEIGETCTKSVRIVSGITSAGAHIIRPRIYVSSHENNHIQCVYLNGSFLSPSTIFTGIFASLNSTKDNAGRVYSVFVDLNDKVVKFTRLA